MLDLFTTAVAAAAALPMLCTSYFHMDNGAVVTDAFIQFQDMLFIMNYRARKAIQNDEYSGCIILYHFSMHTEMV